MNFKQRLLVETKDLMVKVNKLQGYMRTKLFYELDREHKDLLYSQLKAMLDYLHILGKRCELLEIKIDIF